MCYPCLMNCENCKQKYLFCPNCGEQNMIVRQDCINCGLVFTDEIKEESKIAWKERTNKALGIDSTNPA